MEGKNVFTGEDDAMPTLDEEENFLGKPSASGTPKIQEDYIVSGIPDELTLVLQTAVLLQIELDIDKEPIFARVPRITIKESDDSEDEKDEAAEINDISINSKNLLCSAHLGKLIDILEKSKDTVPMRGILECRAKDQQVSDQQSSVSST